MIEQIYIYFSMENDLFMVKHRCFAFLVYINFFSSIQKFVIFLQYQYFPILIFTIVYMVIYFIMFLKSGYDFLQNFDLYLGS